MKLGMINSFLIVCFTMVQKYSVREKKYRILTKISLHGYKTIFKEKKCVTINTSVMILHYNTTLTPSSKLYIQEQNTMTHI